MERDNAIPDRRPRAYGRNTDVPLFVKKERPPLPFGVKVYNQEQTYSSGSENSTSQSAGSTTSAPEQPVLPAQPAHPRRGWLNGRNRRIGLQEAFARTQYDGGVRPRTAQGIVHSGGDDVFAPTPAPESRVPRAMTYSSGEVIGSSPPKIIKEMFVRAEREERKQSAPSIEDTGSESSGLRDGSPSPAPTTLNRRNVLDEEAREARYQSRLARDRANSAYASVRNSASKTKEQQESDLAELEGYRKHREKMERAQARIKRLAANQTPIFSPEKPYDSSRHFARAGDITETRRTLARKASTSSFGETDASRNANIISFDDEPEPPIRSSSTWGSKAKKYPGWMQRIISPDDSPEFKHPDPVPTEDQLQQIAADIPLPSVELGSSAQEPTPPSSRPASAQPNDEYQNMSPERSPEKILWDADIDFTGTSIQVSDSPIFRPRGRRLDEVRDRKIQSLSARAVATNRLEEIRERNSEERSLRDTTPNPESVHEPEEEFYHEKTILEEEGYHIPGTPITVFPPGCYKPSSSCSSNYVPPGHKCEDSYETLRKLARLLSKSPAPQDLREEDEGERLAEFDLAQRRKEESAEQVEKSEVEKREAKSENSRSKSAQASVEVEEEDEAPAQKLVEQLVKNPTARPGDTYEKVLKSNTLETDVQIKRRSRASTPPKSDVDPEERIEAEARLFDLQDNRSERNSIRAPSRSPSPADDDQFDETPRPKADPLSLPTPRVTGAYIETPAPSTQQVQKRRPISPSYELVEPTAAAADSHSENQALRHHNRSKSTSQERATPASKEAIRPQTASRIPQLQQRPRGTSLHREVTERQLQSQNVRPPLINTAKTTSAAEDLRSLELEAGIEDSTLDNFETVFLHEAAATRSMRRNSETENFIDQLYLDKDLAFSVAARERAVDRATMARMDRKLRNTTSSLRETGHGLERLHDKVATAIPSPCKKPKDHDDGHYIRLEVKLPRLWINNPEQPPARGRFAFLGSRNWKFTWLGLILFLFSLWFVTESAMCEVYCHPKYASRNTWKYTDPFFPWAIPTKLDQWTGTVVSTAAYKAKGSYDDWKDPHGLRYQRHPNVQYGANDWWLGRGYPIGMVKHDNDETYGFSNDEIMNDD